MPPDLTTCKNTFNDGSFRRRDALCSINTLILNLKMKTSSTGIIHAHTCSSSILRSRQSCSSDDGSESAGAAVLWLLMLLDVPGNFTATYAPSTLSTWDKIRDNVL